MNQKNTLRVALALVLAGMLFFLASPISDWIMERVKKTEPVGLPHISQTEAPLKLPQLKLRRDVLKSPAPETAEPKLPAPKATTSSTSLGNDEIEQAVEQHQQLFQRCWTQRLRENPALKGNVLLQFEITTRGKVQAVQIAESNITDETMLHCLVSVLERIPFRDFSGPPVTLTFPLSFE